MSLVRVAIVGGGIGGDRGGLVPASRWLGNHLPDSPEQQARDAAFAQGEPLRQSAWLYGHVGHAPSVGA